MIESWNEFYEQRAFFERLKRIIREKLPVFKDFDYWLPIQFDGDMKLSEDEIMSLFSESWKPPKGYENERAETPAERLDVLLAHKADLYYDTKTASARDEFREFILENMSEEDCDYFDENEKSIMSDLMTGDIHLYYPYEQIDTNVQVISNKGREEVRLMDLINKRTMKKGGELYVA